MKKAPAFIPTCMHWKLKVVTSDFYPHLVLTDFPSYNYGQNGCCLAYIGNTSNLDSNHFVHHCMYSNRRKVSGDLRHSPGCGVDRWADAVNTEN